jgi:hypothetical protein
VIALYCDCLPIVQATLNSSLSAALSLDFVHCFYIHAKQTPWKSGEGMRQPRTISRDAVAHLISLRSVSGDLKAPVLVDVRRHDERALFGGVQGSVHVPVEQVAHAIQMSSAAFEEAAGTTAWSKDDLLIFMSRECCRAKWAAQLVTEKG